MPLPGSVTVRKILSFRACTTFPPLSLSSNLNRMSACECAREHVRGCLRERECVSVVYFYVYEVSGIQQTQVYGARHTRGIRHILLHALNPKP